MQLARHDRGLTCGRGLVGHEQDAHQRGNDTVCLVTSRRDANHSPCSTRERWFKPCSERHTVVVACTGSCWWWIGDARHAGVWIASTCPDSGIVTSCRYSATRRKSSSRSPTLMRALKNELSTRATSRPWRSSRSHGYKAGSPAEPVTEFRFPAFRHASSGRWLILPRCAVRGARCAVAQPQNTRRTRLREFTSLPRTDGCMPLGRYAACCASEWPPTLISA